jgi:plastocyanin
MLRRAALAFLATGLLAVTAACGGDDGGAATTTAPVDADLVVRAVPSIRWDASSYSVDAGEVTILLQNDDSVRHTLVVLDGDTRVGGLQLEVNRRGDSDSGTVTLEPGTYRIFCTVPGHQNMNSELIVS